MNDEHQKNAYGTLHNVAETLRVLIAFARSSQQPLELPDNIIDLLRDARGAVLTAQREMEKLP